MTVQDAIIYVVLVARVAIAVRLVQLAVRGARSLYWLAGVFLVNAVYYLFATGPFAISFYVSHLSYTIGLTIAQLLVVVFIHSTFYQGKKSPFKVFLAASLIVGIVDTILAVLYGPVISLTSGMVAVNWGWHAVIAFRAYKEVADEKYVEDWVKARYKLMIAYCTLLATTGIMLIGYLLPVSLQVIQAVVGLFALAGVVVQFLVWVMPERFREFLNRNYHPEILSDEQEPI